MRKMKGRKESRRLLLFLDEEARGRKRERKTCHIFSLLLHFARHIFIRCEEGCVYVENEGGSSSFPCCCGGIAVLFLCVVLWALFVYFSLQPKISVFFS